MLDSDNSLKSSNSTPVISPLEESSEKPKPSRGRPFSGLSFASAKQHYARRFSMQNNSQRRQSITALGQTALSSSPSPTPKKSLEDIRIENVIKKIGIYKDIEEVKQRLKVTDDKELKLNFLEKQGFLILVNKLRDKSGYPWNCILAVEDPKLIEQLVLLYEVMEMKGETESSKLSDNVLIFALFSCQNSVSNSDYETLSMMGKLIFLANKNLSMVKRNVHLDQVEKTVDWIRLQLDVELLQIQQKMRSYYNAHKDSQLQDAKVASRIQLAIEIAKLIFTDNGIVNIGIIQPLIDVFIKEKEVTVNHELSLLYGLNLLLNNPKLRDKFLKLLKPLQMQYTDLPVSIILGYPSPADLSELDMRRAALAGLLSHLRQTPSGSCFATCLAIELLSSQLGRCLDDFIEIIQTSCLIRKINNVNIEFPFMVSAHNKALEVEFCVEVNGNIGTTTKTTFLWEAPGIIAACYAMGILDVQKTVEKVLHNFFQDSQNTDLSKTITVDEFLRLLAEYSFENKLLPIDKSAGIFKKGGFAFDSQTSNALLNAWMNSIANMSEAISSSMIKSQIFKALNACIDASELVSPMTLNKVKLTFYSNFSKEFFKRVRLEYDPSIKGSGSRIEHQSSDGAFVLYDKGIDGTPRGWIRIDNSEAFQNFLISLLDCYKINISSVNYTGSQLNFLDLYIQQLMTFIKSDKFLIKLLQNYDPLHAAGKNNLEDLLNLPYTPWITKSGNDSTKTLQVYLEHENAYKTEKFSPPHAEALLQKIIEVGKCNTDSEKLSYMKNPNKLIPIRLPGIHAFSLMLGHHTLISSWKNSTESDEWIVTNVIDPGKKIANMETPSFLQNSLVQYCVQNLVSTENKEKFLKTAKHLADKSSVTIVRNRLLGLVQSYTPLEGDHFINRACKFDTFLYQNLPTHSKYLLEKSAIHFADTNWGNGIHDIHFCFVVNPGTAQLEMWEALDNGTLLMGLDQKKWFHKPVWEFYSDSTEILPNDE